MADDNEKITQKPCGFFGLGFSWAAFWRFSMYLGAMLCRVALVAYSTYHDEHYEVKFTDVDYSVFTDAASMILEGRSVYDRHTYRYTPFLAYMMIPTITLHRDFGKLLFSFFDIVTGYMVEKTLDKPRLLWPALWLFNPFVMSISARGNADCLICFFVIATVYCLKKGHIFWAAVFYGLSVHFKIYPIIYAMPIMLFLYSDTAKRLPELRGKFKDILCFFLFGINLKHLLFAFVSASVFFSTGYMAYRLYGFDFIYESYLYHYIRQDHRHNFSVYFYYMYYLVDAGRKMNPLITFLPQLVCVVSFGMLGIWDLELSLFLQTISFVSLNKVCTCQYYLWWLCLMPLVLAKISFNRKNVIALFIAIGCFVFSNMLWLFFAYLLEIQGYNTFIMLLYSSALFVISQMAIGWVILQQVPLPAPGKKHTE